MRRGRSTTTAGRLTVEVRKGLASIHIYRMRGQGIEPSDSDIAKRYLVTMEAAREVLKMTPQASELFPASNASKWS